VKGDHLFVANNGNGTVSRFALTSISTAALNVRSSLFGRPMSLGGANNAAVPGINLTSEELARVFCATSGTITLGDVNQTGNITITTSPRSHASNSFPAALACFSWSCTR
jgi:hypothetical protein